MLAAVGYEVGFECAFARQIEEFDRPGDVAIVILQSGKSPNVLAGLRRARAQGLIIAALGGRAGR